MSDVGRWLEGLGLGRYAEAFAAHDIDLDIVAELSEPDLERLGVSLGDRKRLLRAIAGLAGAAPAVAAPAPPPQAAAPARRSRRAATRPSAASSP